MVSLAWVVAAAWIADAPGEDSSSEPFLPVEYGYRSATLPRGVFRVDGASIVSHAPFLGTEVLLTFDLGYGVTDWLEVGFSVPALALSPVVDGFDPAVYVTAGLTPTDWLMLYPLARVSAPLHAGDVWWFDLDLGASLILAPSIQLFTAPTFTTSLAKPAQRSAAFPLGLFVQAHERLFVQAGAGLALNRASPRFMAVRPIDVEPRDQTMLVVSSTIGYTLGRADRTLTDVYVTWFWPGLVASDHQGTTTGVNDWSLTLGVSVHLPQLRSVSTATR